MNDDRLGRCLDDLAAVHDRLRGDLTVQAIRAFGLATTTLRWDLTSVLVTGEYPPEEQTAGYAQVRYGYGGGRQKQVRYLQVTTDDGAVPVWEQVHDGNTTDVATVVATMEALREHARCSDFVLVGDSKLLTEANRRALLAAEVGYLAPLARTPELDAAFLAIPPEAWCRWTTSASGSGASPRRSGQLPGCARAVEVGCPTPRAGRAGHGAAAVRGQQRGARRLPAQPGPPAGAGRGRDRAGHRAGSAAAGTRPSSGRGPRSRPSSSGGT